MLKAFTGRYSGDETLSAEILMAADPRILEGAPPEVAAAAAKPVDTVPKEILESGKVPILPGAKLVAVPDPTVPGGERYRMQGTVAGRRIPTQDEIARINESLKGLGGAPVPPPTVEAPAVAPKQ
jgi:hypothetical protein